MRSQVHDSHSGLVRWVASGFGPFPLGGRSANSRWDEALPATALGSNGFGGCQGAVNGGSGDVEQFGKIGDGVFAGTVHAAQRVCCLVDSLGLRPVSRPLARATAIPRGCACAADRFQIPRGRQNVEEQLSHWVGRAVDLAAKGRLDATGREPVADVACVGDRPGEPVEFRHHEGVAFAEGSERLVEAGARPVGAGEPVVEVNPVPSDAEFPQPLTLRGQILRSLD